MVKILVVDDDPFVAEFIFDMLRRAGYVVDAAHNGMQAVNLCVENRYAMVISDLNMPDINGLELLEMVRAQRPGMPFIYMTGDDSLPDVERCDQADAFIRKRDGISSLLGKVHEIISRKGTNAGSSQLRRAVE